MTTTTAPLTDTVEILPALERWTTFTDALADETIAVHLGTEDVVAALIDRSIVEEDLQSGTPFRDADLVRLARSDQRYRAAAPRILDTTEIALFTDDEPPTHWWWHVEQLVLGHAGEQLLAVPDAAALKDVHPHTIRAAIKDGRLPARRLARGFLIHRRDLERWQPRAVGRPRGSSSIRTHDTLLESLNDANTHQDWARAAQLAETMERDPSSPRRCLAIALTAFNAGEDEKAEQWAARALEGELPQASRQTALLVQGRALLREGHPRKALGILESARGLGYSDWLIESALAEAYLELGDSRRAVEVARRAASEAPDVPEVHYLLARMLWHHDEPWEALEQVVRFREHRPDEVDAILLHGSILGYLGDLTGQQGLYEQSRAVVKPLVERDLPQALTIDGQSLGSLGRWRAALGAARKLLRLPDDTDYWRHSALHVLRAAVDASLGGPRAEEVAERAIALHGRDGYLELQVATTRAAQGDVAGTLAALHVTMEELHLADPPMRATVAVALLNAGRGAEAFELLEPLAGYLEETPLPILADAAVQAGRMKTAIEAYRRFAARPGNEARIAAIGLRLLEHVRAPARAAARPGMGAWPLGPPWVMPRTDVLPTARESRWEGQHRRTSRVLDDVPLGRIH